MIQTTVTRLYTCPHRLFFTISDEKYFLIKANLEILHITGLEVAKYGREVVMM